MRVSSIRVARSSKEPQPPLPSRNFWVLAMRVRLAAAIERTLKTSMDSDRLLAQKPVLEGVEVVEGRAVQAAAPLGAGGEGARRGCRAWVEGLSWGKLGVGKKIEYRFYIIL